jgi:hypothetical protein
VYVRMMVPWPEKKRLASARIRQEITQKITAWDHMAECTAP